MVAHLAQSKDEEILLARVYEKISHAEQRQIPAATCFLSEREQAMTQQLLRGMQVIFFGGFEGAERKVCCWLPEYLEEDWLYGDDSPIAAVRAEFYEAGKLSHRDVLGALMGCGIERETVGDILMGENSCDFFVTQKMLPYVLQNLDKAGRSHLSLRQISLNEVRVPQENLKQIKSTVSSPRLDAVVGTGFGLSRAKAAALIESGRVELDHLPCIKPDKTVQAGCVISARGLGKIRLEEQTGTTKKGRTGVVISRFV